MSNPSGTQGSKTGSVMVIGGGIGGVQASLDLADSGYKVYLVDERPDVFENVRKILVPLLDGRPQTASIEDEIAEPSEEIMEKLRSLGYVR